MSKIPQNATTVEQVVELERDNIETPGGMAWLVGDDHVSVHLAPGEWVEIPREDLDAFVRWYTTGEFAD